MENVCIVDKVVRRTRMHPIPSLFEATSVCAMQIKPRYQGMDEYQ